MRLGGKRISINRVPIVIPRPETGEDLVFIATAVMDFDEFDKMVAEPNPPMIKKRGSYESEPDVTDRNYREQIKYYGEMKHAYFILKSLEATPDLEWETVNMDDPNTWTNYEKELKESGFSQVEINMIIKGVWQANALDEEMLKKARERFLSMEQSRQPLTQSPLRDDQENTQSSELVNVSESNHRA